MGALRRRPVALAVAISALLSAVYLFWQPPVQDLAAQTFRADLWEREGWVLWSDAWYSGFTVPGYSLLYPPLGALFGPELLGALCAVAAAVLFALIAERAYGERAWLGAAWFGAASTVALFGGRTTFALGLALGLGALWALQRGRAGLGAVSAVATGLASPVAGLFTALAAGAVLAARGVDRRAGGCNEGEGGEAGEPGCKKPPYSGRNPHPSVGRAALAVLVAASASTLLPSLLFPIDGYQPFTAGAFIPVILAVSVVLFLLPEGERVLRIGVALYAALTVVAFVFETPLGGNTVRLGATFAGPVLALALFGRRPLALALVALPLLWWQWTAQETAPEAFQASGDPAARAEYFDPLVAELERRAPGGEVRIEIPPTRNRWESAYVAPEFPLARGWLRQLETDDFDLFTDGNLDPPSYAQWLYAHGVSFVALADAELDYLAEDEAELLEAGGLRFLREVWSDEHWRLFEVRYADGTRTPTSNLLGTGGAVVTALGPDEFSVRVPRPGDYLLALRFSHLFQVTGGDACLESAGAPSTRLTAGGDGPQTIEITTRLSADGLLRPDRVCSG